MVDSNNKGSIEITSESQRQEEEKEEGDKHSLSENPFFALAREQFEVDTQDGEGFVELEKNNSNDIP